MDITHFVKSAKMFKTGVLIEDLISEGGFIAVVVDEGEIKVCLDKVSMFRVEEEEGVYLSVVDKWYFVPRKAIVLERATRAARVPGSITMAHFGGGK